MTKRYFYDCPLKAAYMVRYHGIKIHGPVRKFTGEIDTSNRPMPVWILARVIEAAEKAMGPQDARYYIASESLALFRPQPRDLLTGRTRRVFMFYDNRITPTENALIAERNAIPFIWPESETET
jgi:hypothetical protein